MSSARLFLSVFLTWLVPGLGHYSIGRRGKAAYFFVLLVALYVTGMALAEFRNVSIERHPYFSLAYGFMGLPTLVALVATAPLRVENDLNPDLGCLLTAVAGLLNVLVMIDAYTIAEDSRSHPAAAGAASAS